MRGSLLNCKVRLLPGKRHLISIAVLFLTLPSVTCPAGDVASADTRSLLDLSVDEMLDERIATVRREDSAIGQSAAAVSESAQEMIRRWGVTTFMRIDGMTGFRTEGSSGWFEIDCAAARKNPLSRLSDLLASGGKWD
jgi:hypothetical protein